MMLLRVYLIRKTRTNRLPATASYTSLVSYQEHTSDQSPGRQFVVRPFKYECMYEPIPYFASQFRLEECGDLIDNARAALGVRE